jgi:DNA-binding winged helix-turn-helix (wHTH) protein
MTEQALDTDLRLNSAADTPKSAARGWQAGDLVIDPELRCVRRGGERVVVQEIPFRLLCLLVERGGRPVSRRELHEKLWPRYDWGSFERNLNTAVRKLRRSIGDDAREPRLIETLRASGYRWIGPPVQELAAIPAPEQPADSVPQSRRTYRRLAAVAFIACCAVVALLIVGTPSPSSSWLVIDGGEQAGGSIAPGSQASALADALRAALAGTPRDSGEAVHVALSTRNGEPFAAEVIGRGTAQHIALDASVFGRERLLAEVANRLPASALRRPDVTLPAAAQQAFADAGTLLAGGASNIDTVEHAVKLIETVLSAAPGHAGALRTYARSQRMLAVLGRDPAAARERRLLARDALRRAVLADPRSAGVASDVASHLFWGEWNTAEAADWFALARLEAPQDAQVLRGYAWFALADDRIDEAMSAMNTALAASPLDVGLHADLGWFWFRTGHHDDALRQCRLALGMSAANTSAQICEERALAESGHADQAWFALRGHAPDWLDAASRSEFDALDPAEAYRAAMHLDAASTRKRIGAGYDSACLEAIAGRREAVDADLAAAIALGDPGLHLARVTPELVHLLGEQAARQLAQRDSLRLAAARP